MIPYSVKVGYMQEECLSYMYVESDEALLALVIGDQGDDIYISIEDPKYVCQDIIIPKHKIQQIVNYLNSVNH